MNLFCTNTNAAQQSSSANKDDLFSFGTIFPLYFGSLISSGAQNYGKIGEYIKAFIPPDSICCIKLF